MILQWEHVKIRLFIEKLFNNFDIYNLLEVFFRNWIWAKVIYSLTFFLQKSGHSVWNHAKYNYYYALQNQNQIQFPFFCQISSNYRYRWWLKSLIEKRKRLRNPVSTEVVLSYNFFLVKAETSPEECLLSMAFLFFELDSNLGFLVRVFLLGQNVCVFVFTILCLHTIIYSL